MLSSAFCRRRPTWFSLWHDQNIQFTTKNSPSLSSDISITRKNESNSIFRQENTGVGICVRRVNNYNNNNTSSGRYTSIMVVDAMASSPAFRVFPAGRKTGLQFIIINVWNRLSDEMVNASNVSSFNCKRFKPIWNLDLLVHLSSTLIIIIFNVLLILVTCVTKLLSLFNRYIRILFVFYRIL